jgi:hypothetical protein
MHRHEPSRHRRNQIRFRDRRKSHGEIGNGKRDATGTAAHSEDISDQERSVVLCRLLGPPNSGNSERHRDIVRRFGRFPHRNPILGRTMTEEEQDFLDQGGYAG